MPGTKSGGGGANPRGTKSAGTPGRTRVSFSPVNRALDTWRELIMASIIFGLMVQKYGILMESTLNSTV